MSGENYNYYFDVLELGPDASMSEVRKAYQELKQLYSSDSIVTLPIAEEFSEANKKEVLNEIEEAYGKLMTLFRREYRGSGNNGMAPSVICEDIRDQVEAADVFSGQVLRQIREKLKIDLSEIEACIKVGKYHLKNIEQENFGALPPEVYLKGFLTAYAKHLSLDPTRVVNDYLKTYHEWKLGQ